ncbi:hypothetical protein METHB2_300006 [Candidatus Methylobacter favarea]|uniref:Uncharacterized protein n=1 Tax=Candidatus Methylobacter favarea TaxID=2707345 RepID=A0A8S0X0Z8_9GAMM|nr:hypothetical protein METHB2_300006 [Candidatus Methylobacter favarea]
MRGVGLVIRLPSEGSEHHPLDYRLYENTADGKTKTTISARFWLMPARTKAFVQGQCCSTTGMRLGKT